MVDGYDNMFDEVSGELNNFNLGASEEENLGNSHVAISTEDSNNSIFADRIEIVKIAGEVFVVGQVAAIITVEGEEHRKMIPEHVIPVDEVTDLEMRTHPDKDDEVEVTYPGRE